MLEFLSLKTESFGLEITDSYLKFLKLKQKNGKFSCVSLGVAPLNAGIVINGEVKDIKLLADAIKAALRKVKGDKIDTKYAVISLPDDKAFLQVIQMPKISENDLRGAVVLEAENFVPMPLEKVYLDFQVIPSIIDIDHLDILMAAYPRHIVDSYIAAAKGAGLKPVALELESQAIARATVGDFCDSPVLIIQVGENRTNLIIYAGYSLRYTFSLPISNNYFIETISKSLGVDQKTATELKAKYGIEKYGFEQESVGKTDKKAREKSQKDGDIEQRKIFEALVPGLTDFIQQIGKYSNYYHSHASHEHLPKDKRMISKIILCGSGASLKGLDKFLALKLSLPVDIARPADPIKFEKNAKAFLAGENACGFSTVLGLATRGFKSADERL